MFFRKNIILPALHLQLQISRNQYNVAGNPIKMAFNVFGTDVNENNPLIIMHGLFGSKQNWRGVSRALESKIKRKIYTVDARNHGDSPHTVEHSTAHMAVDVEEFMRQENMKKACVMGHSMGGRTMMHLALRQPYLVDRAIIVDISPISVPRDFSHMEEIFSAMKKINVSSSLSMAQGRKQVESQIKAAVRSRETVDFIMLNLRKKATGEFYWIPNIESLHNNLRLFDYFLEEVSHLPPFTGPVMFICGNQSNFVDPKSWPDIQKIFPNSEVHWLDAGHLVHFDQPQIFIKLVVDFLKV